MEQSFAPQIPWWAGGAEQSTFVPPSKIRDSPKLFSSNHSTPIDDNSHHVMRSSRHPKGLQAWQNSSSSLFNSHYGRDSQFHNAMAKPYVPHDVLDETAKTSLVGLGSGFFIAAIQNALSKRNVGAMSVFTRGAPIIGICGMNRVSATMRLQLGRIFAQKYNHRREFLADGCAVCVF